MMRAAGLSRTPPRINVREAELADSEALAGIHAQAFRRGWSAAEIEALLCQEAVTALIADYRPPLRRPLAAGFCLLRVAADEAEILSIAVAPSCRRRGVGRALMEEALRRLYRDAVAALHLEVDPDNEAAMRLYAGLEFEAVGERLAYYRQGLEAPRGALVMRRQVR